MDAAAQSAVQASRDPAEGDLLRNERLAAAKLWGRDLLIGLVAAIASVVARYSFDLPPEVLPFFLVVIAVCLVTVNTGLVGGITTMVVGGLLGWYFILTPGQFGLYGSTPYTLLGFFAVISVILSSSQLYRLSERNRQEAALMLAVQEAEQQALFAREMSHRLKNAMAIVQAIAGQTFTQEGATAKFDGRLRALAEAHNLLNEHVRQPSASVEELVETATRPFHDRDGRFVLSGPAATIPDQQVISLALALHELGTNAVKYGALSTDAGWVSVDWDLKDGKVQLIWKEHGGPKVTRPRSQGFGTRLLKRSAMGADLRYEPDGVCCVISQRF